MKRGELEALRRTLGGVLPPGIEALEAPQVAKLCSTVEAARTRQQAQIESALQAALAHLPALLRGPVRKLFDA